MSFRCNCAFPHIISIYSFFDPLLKQIFVFDTLFEGLSALALGPMATLGFVPVLLLTLRAAVAVRLASLAELPRRPIERHTASRARFPEVEKSTTYFNHSNHSCGAHSCIVRIIETWIKEPCRLDNICPNLSLWEIGQGQAAKETSKAAISLCFVVSALKIASVHHILAASKSSVI